MTSTPDGDLRGPAEPSMPGWQWLPTPVLVVTAGGVASAVNAAFSEVTGISNDAAQGVGWRAALMASAHTPLLAALAAERDFRLQLGLQRSGADAASEPTWVDCSARWLPAIGRYLCQLHVVSAVRTAEAGARAQAQQLRMVANNVPALIAAFDARDNRCLFANAGYARTFGLTEQSILGRTVEDVIGADAMRLIEPYVTELRQHHRAARYERELSTPTGPRWIEVHLLPHVA